MGNLPVTGYIRLSDIIGNRKADPPIQPLIPVSKSTWYAGVSSGIYPQAVKLGAKSVAWRVEDIRALMDRINVCRS